MVFFNCNACGEALKKGAVEKHYLTKCRQCEVLSCVDCGKDFWGDDYKQHVKCISEEEKYSGKDYKPKSGANKGEKKQELWIEQVHEAIQKASGNAGVKGVLQKLIDYPNIPRKQKAFVNFLKNSLRVYNDSLANQVWDALSSSIPKPGNSAPNPKTENGTCDDSTKTEKKSDHSEKNGIDSEDCEKKGKKKEGKSEEENAVENGTKKKKRKRNESEKETSDVEKSKKKKKRKDDLVPDSNEEMSEQKSKFKLESCIVRILSQRDDKELSVKKLKKKILSEYCSLVDEENRVSEEQLLAKFEKRVNKSSKLKLKKDRVKLLTES